MQKIQHRALMLLTGGIILVAIAAEQRLLGQIGTSLFIVLILALTGGVLFSASYESESVVASSEVHLPQAVRDHLRQIYEVSASIAHDQREHVHALETIMEKSRCGKDHHEEHHLTPALTCATEEEIIKSREVLLGMAVLAEKIQQLERTCVS